MDKYNVNDTKLRIYESYDAGIITESEKNQYLEVIETFMDEYNPPKTIKKSTLSQLKVSPSVKHFMLTQGGAKQNCYIKINNSEYEVRAVLTIGDGYWSIEKVIKSILNDSNNKLIPIAVDSGSNYYCVDLKGSTVYRENHEEEGFEKLCPFTEFKKQVSKAKTVKESVVVEATKNDKLNALNRLLNNLENKAQKLDDEIYKLKKAGADNSHSSTSGYKLVQNKEEAHSDLLNKIDTVKREIRKVEQSTD